MLWQKKKCLPILSTSELFFNRIISQKRPLYEGKIPFSRFLGENPTSWGKSPEWWGKSLMYFQKLSGRGTEVFGKNQQKSKSTRVLFAVGGLVGPYPEKSKFSESTLEKCIRYFQKVPAPPPLPGTCMGWKTTNHVN